MELINNRYRIVRNLSSYEGLSGWIVCDLGEGGAEKTMHIVDTERFADKLSVFLQEDYLHYSKLRAPYVLRCQRFTPRLSGVDRERGTSERELCFVSERAENMERLLDVMPKLSEETRLDMFAQACRALYYLHIKNVVYRDLCFRNLFVSEQEGEFSIRLRDLCSLRLCSIAGQTDDDMMYFAAPELIYEGKYSPISDVYSLGALMFRLFFGRYAYAGTFAEDIQNLDKSELTGLAAELYPVVLRAAASPEKRYQSVIMLVSALNSALGRNPGYAAFDKAETERLLFGSRLVGRTQELRTLLAAAKDSGGQNARCFAVHGEAGVGKSFFLSVLRNCLLLQSAPVYWAFGYDGDGAMGAVLRQMTIRGRNESQSSDMQGFDRNVIVKFMYECVKDSPVVFIIDDLDRADDFSIVLFDNLLKLCGDIVFIFSHRDGHNNKRLKEFMESANRVQMLSCVELQALSVDDTAALIGSALSSRSAPRKFAEMIDKKAFGNPLFIEEILSSLHRRGVLSADERTGEWQSDYLPSEYGGIEMPESITHAVEERAGRLDGESVAVLEYIAVFDRLPVTAPILMDFGCREDRLQEILKQLVEEGILFISGGIGSPYSFSFANKLMKSHIYERCDGELQKTLHNQAASILLADPTPDILLLDELAIHLRAAERREELIDCYEKLAIEADKAKDFDGSATYRGKAMGLLRPEDQDGVRALNLLLGFGRAQIKSANYIPAEVNLTGAYELAGKLGKAEARARAAVELGCCHNDMRDPEQAMRWLLKAEAYFMDAEFKAAHYPLYMDFQLARLDSMRLFGMDVDFPVIALAALDECPDNLPEHMSRILIHIGMYYLSGARFSECVAYFREAVMYAGESVDEDCRERALYNLCYALKKAGNGDESAEIAQKLHKESKNPYIIGMLHNIAAEEKGLMYEPLEAAMIASSALDLFTLSGNTRHSMKSRLLLADYHIQLLQYLTAVEHLEAAGQILGQGVSAGSGSFMLKCISASVYFACGQYDKAAEEAAAARSLSDGQSLFVQMADYRLSLFEMCGHYASDNYPKAGAKAISEWIESTLTENPEDIACTLEFLVSEYRQKRSEHVAYALKFALQTAWRLKHVSLCLEQRVLLAESYTKRGGEKLVPLERALKVSEDCGQTLFTAIICEELGMYHKRRNSYQSLVYFARACEAVKAQLDSCPDGLRVTLVRRYALTSPFERVAALRHKKPAFGGSVDIIYDPELFNELSGKDHLLTAGRKTFLSELPYDIANEDDLLRYLGSDQQLNLSMLARYCAAFCCAQRCVVMNGDLKVMAVSSGAASLPGGHLLPARSKALERDILIREGDDFGDGATWPETVKAAACLTVRLDGKDLGYVYIYTDSVFHGINQASVNELSTVLKLIGLNIAMDNVKSGSMLDKLTGALNRKFLEAAIDRQIEVAHDAGTSFALIMLDLDNFKSINDSFGHQTGDAVLAGLGRTMSQNLRKDTAFGRYGGEEFIVILDNASPAGAMRTAEKLRLAIRDARMLGSRRVVTVSAGVAVYGEHGITKEELIGRADTALYAAKERGKNRCELYAPLLERRPKRTGAATGVITGDTIKDAMRMRMTLESIELAKGSNCLASCLEKVSAITEASAVSYFGYNEDGPILRVGAGSFGSWTADDFTEVLYMGEECRLFTEGENTAIAVTVAKEGETVGLICLCSDSLKRVFSQEDAASARYMADLIRIVV